MSNDNTQAAWRYHDGTKHPGGDLMDPMHRFDPSQRPLPLKIYQDAEPVSLDVDTTPIGVPALEAIATAPEPGDEAQTPDIDQLARILYFSAGITKKIRYPWGEMLFRAAACTGALYHIELYVVCGDLPGLDAGVYHYAPNENALKRLRSGDYRRVLVEASGEEPAVAHAPAIIVYTDVFWRNAVKYQAREYRHAFWDSGTIISHTLAVAAAHGLPAKVVAGFVDGTVNHLLDLDTEKEVALELVAVGHDPDASPASPPEVSPLSLETAPVDQHERIFPPIHEMHDASSLKDAEEARAWHGETPALDLPPPSGQLVSLRPLENVPQDSIEGVIVRRGSTRQFARQPIRFEQLATVLQAATQDLPADFRDPPDAALNHLYLIVNAVDDLEPGTYVYHRERQALELLKQGRFRQEAGYLGLQQALAADASVNIYFMADLESILARYGNRGYRAAQLDASIAAGRFYLAAYAQKTGATGLTFFDDAVTDFFSPHAADKSVMFLIALGIKASRR